jgi:DNA-binding transcriptional MerR regulator
MTRENIHHLPRLGMGDAMRLFGMTARALRFYEEKGLVEARRDRLNARYFDGAARQRLAWISRLRAAGVSLPEICEVLEAEEAGGRGREQALKMVERRKAELQAELARVEETLASLGPGDEPGLRRVAVSN